MTNKNHVFLDIDSKIWENNLLLMNNMNEANYLEKMFNFGQNSSNEDKIANVIYPLPGLVIKTFNSGGNKVFINLCKSDLLPEPKELTEEKLIAIWKGNGDPHFKLQLSMLEPHYELDRSGKKVIVYDVAMNTKFFEDVKCKSNIFSSIVIEMILEALEDKYGLELIKEDYVILKNKKNIGELKPHKIRITKSQPSKTLIQEINLPNTENSGRKAVINDILENFNYRLIFSRSTILGQFYLPKIKTLRDIKLDVGENRITLETDITSNKTDIFLPHKISEFETLAHFHLTKKILTVLMPRICA